MSSAGDYGDGPQHKKSSTNSSWMIPGHERYGGPMTGSIQMVEGSKSVLNNGYKEVDATSPAVIPEGDQIHVKFVWVDSFYF